MRRMIACTIVLFCSANLFAEEDVKLEDLADAPPPPSVIDSGETLEPEITISNKNGEKHEEYRLHGQLYMVKITPAVGPSYYLVDKDGNGTMETSMSEIYHDFVVPQWVLFSW